jgi:hypothetical protein
MDTDQKELQKMAEKIAKEQVGKFMKGMATGSDLSSVMDAVAAASPVKGNSCNIPATNNRNSNPLPAKHVRQDVRDLLVKSDTIKCQECGHYTFENVFLIKRVSPLISPTGEELVLPVQVFQCTQCRGINDMFLPHAAIADIREEQKPNTKKKRIKKKEKQRREKKEKQVLDELMVDESLR